MKQSVIANNIKNVIQTVLETHGVDLVDIELKGGSGNQILRIFIDQDDGVDLDLCTLVSREISDILDTEDIMKNRYRLEVSSPGFDRPLKNIKDFKRNIDRKVEVEFLNKNNEKIIISGIIQDVSIKEIALQSEKEIIYILLESIQSAKILPLW